MIINNIYNRDFINRMQSLLPDHKNYFHIDINNQKNFDLVYDLKPRIKHENLNILFDCAMEGYRSVVETIYREVVIGEDINEENIFLISGATDIEQIVEEESIKFHKRPFPCIWMREFEHFVSFRAAKKTHFPEVTEYKKSYICLNRRWRLQRPILFSLLAKYNLLDHGFVSFDYSEVEGLGWDKIKDSLLATHRTDKEIFDYILKNTEYLKSLTPMRLDVVTATLDRPFEIQSELDYYYENSFFSLVTETNFYTDPAKYNSIYIQNCEGTRFLSEKTFKPMYYKHPFILTSVPKMLELLKELGYKTFHPYIDESYDNEPNDGKRMLMIVKEVEKLCKLDKHQQKQFIEDTRHIVEHNFKLLATRYKELFAPNLTVDFRS